MLLNAPHDVGSGVQRADNAWVELLQCRQQFLANAIPEESGVLVGLILTPLNPGLLHKLPNLTSSGPKQRAGKDQPTPQRTNRGDTGKPGNAASAKQVHQQGFGVVVGGVAGQDDGVSVAAGNTFQKLVAGFSGSVFQRKFLFGSKALHLGPSDKNFQSPLTRLFIDKG